MKSSLQQKIDLYHSGRMSPEESLLFEKELSGDPSLQAESDFQKGIIDGIKDYRKAQLKARLGAIDVSPTWVDFVQQSTLLKSFGGVAVATLVGTGVYFLAEPSTEVSPEENTIFVDAPVELISAYDWSITPAPLSEKVDTGKVPSAGVREQENSEEAATASVQEETSSFDFTPEFNAPGVKDVQDEEAPRTSSLERLPENGKNDIDETPIDVNYELTDALDIKYKYYDGKLFLSGDFDKAPYEILEINSASGRRIYVKYLDKYYQVGTTDRLKALPEVKDAEVIKELRLLRENK